MYICLHTYSYINLFSILRNDLCLFICHLTFFYIGALHCGQEEGQVHDPEIGFREELHGSDQQTVGGKGCRGGYKVRSKVPVYGEYWLNKEFLHML